MKILARLTHLFKPAPVHQDQTKTIVCEQRDGFYLTDGRITFVPWSHPKETAGLVRTPSGAICNRAYMRSLARKAKS